MFSGAGEVSKHYRAQGLVAGEYDYIHDNRAMNFLSPAGFASLCVHYSPFILNLYPLCPQSLLQPRLAIHATLCIVPLGLLVAGPDCSSWTVVSRGTSQRSVVNPAGAVRLEWVRENNTTVSRLLRLHYMTPDLNWIDVIYPIHGS